MKLRTLSEWRRASTAATSLSMKRTLQRVLCGYLISSTIMKNIFTGSVAAGKQNNERNILKKVNERFIQQGGIVVHLGLSAGDGRLQGCGLRMYDLDPVR